MTALLLRIFGPKIAAMLPWRMIAWALLAAGVAAALWAGYNHVFDQGRLYERPRATLAGKLAQDVVWRAGIAKARAQATTVVTKVNASDLTITTGVQNDTLAALGDVRRAYDEYRRLHPATAARIGVHTIADLPGVPRSPALAAGAAGSEPVQPSADIVAIAEQGDAWRVQLLGWQDAYARWRAAQPASVPPADDAPALTH